MRRQFLLLLLLVTLGAGVYAYINEKMIFIEAPPVTTKQGVPSKAAKPATPETKKPALSRLPALFPSGPAIWIYSKDLGKIIKQIKESNFYKQGVEYKIFNPSKPFQINVETTANEKSIFSKISSQLEEKTLMDFFGQEIGLAFYPPDKAGTSHYLFAAKISAITKTQEKLQRVKDSLFGEGFTVSEQNYIEQTIVTYTSQKQKYSFHYVIFKNHILGSSSDILLKKGIDLMIEKGENLFIHSDEFNSLFKTSDFSLTGLLFVDIEKIAPNILSNIISYKKFSQKAAEDTKKKLQSFQYLGFTFKIQEGIEIKSAFTINREKADRQLLQTINTAPGKLESLSFMPGKVVIYGANIFEPAHFFEQFIKVLQKKAAGTTVEEFFNELTGVDLEKEIIPFMGNEFFYGVTVQDKTAPMQIPGITVGLQIKDREKIKNLLKKIQTNLTKSSQQRSFQRESYKGYDINFFSLPISVPAQPGYSIVDNFLLFSVNQAGIKRLIDTLKGEISSLQKNKKYLAANIPIKNNGMFFINASLLWDNLSEIITKAPVSPSPASSEQQVEKGLKSLDLLRVAQSFNNVFIYGSNQINSRTFIVLKDIPKIRTNKELMVLVEKSRQKTAPPLSPSKPDQAHGLYTYVYNPAGKRDPFKSLIAGRQTLIKEEQIKAQKFEQFIKNVKSLQPINLHIYNKIKIKDPALYNKLKGYASFFKNKKVMEKVSQKKRIQKLEQYKQLISIAKTNFHDTILGPLQSSQYSSLKLTGIIWGKTGSTALIETPDGRGYSVNVNDLVGPHYGVVKEIKKDKIIVVEKYINYLGKITEKQEEIKLAKSEESL